MCNVKDCTVGLQSLQCFSGAVAYEYYGGPSHDRHMVSHILYLITKTKIVYLSLRSHQKANIPTLLHYTEYITMQAKNVMEDSREKYRCVCTLLYHLTCKKVMWDCTACQCYGQNNQRTNVLFPVMT
jgi:hypothetical protein